MKQWEDDIRDQFQYLSYAPIVFVSALTKQRLLVARDDQTDR